MAERYMFGQQGTVTGIFLPGKAILSFFLHDELQRALLWVKGFIWQGQILEQNDTFLGKLTVGDTIYFDCHVYDKESKDNCGWYATKAWKEAFSETTALPSRVMNQIGYIFELDPGKGIIQFNHNNQDQRVLFFQSKFYHSGKPPGNKHTLSEFLTVNECVHFDAEICQPSTENKMCQWLASVVWTEKKKPSGSALWQARGLQDFDDFPAEDSISNTIREVVDENDYPTLGLPPGLTDRQGYKVYELNTTQKKGPGNVVALINEECGVALWMIRQNVWESVFFHRQNAFLIDISLSKFDLQESLVAGTPVEITAVQAVEEFPCKWIAQKMVANC